MSSYLHDFPVFRYKTVFISDLHLGSGKTASPYLYELLCSLDFKRLKDLYIVGDIVGGWEHQSARQQALPEMEKRILDVINYAASQGVNVHVIPGNHDEKMRPLLPMLQGRRSFQTFPENMHFSNEAFYESSGPNPKRIKIVHGDQHDPDLFVKPWFMPITYATSALYDGMVALNYHASNILYRNFGVHVSFAKALKNAFKSTISYFFSHKSLLQGLQDDSFDGILMGHTHMAGIQKFNEGGRETYLINCGDWVESATAAVVAEGEDLPRILQYKTERERAGFGSLPEQEDPHPACFAAFRPQTDRQIRLLHKLWPARNRAKFIKRYLHAREKLREHLRRNEALDGVVQVLDETGLLTAPVREGLEDIVLTGASDTYKAQRKGLKTIFARYAQNQPLVQEDLIYIKTVAREFKTRSERKIRKHRESMNHTAVMLDLSRGSRNTPVFSAMQIT